MELGTAEWGRALDAHLTPPEPDVEVDEDGYVVCLSGRCGECDGCIDEGDYQYDIATGA